MENDLMIVQRELTTHIRDNMKNQCKVQAKYYSGFKFKSRLECPGML